MKAQTGRTSEKYGGTPAQVTPVIVKSGGGADDEVTARENLVTIDSSMMPFLEPIPGPVWTLAQSSQRGRINELSILDDGPAKDHPIDPSAELASVIINYGADELTLKEEGDTHTGDVYLFIQSPVEFKVKNRKKGEGGWLDSDAPFKSRITRVRFFVGERMIEDYPFKDSDARVNINFQRS